MTQLQQTPARIVYALEAVNDKRKVSWYLQDGNKWTPSEYETLDPKEWRELFDSLAPHLTYTDYAKNGQWYRYDLDSQLQQRAINRPHYITDEIHERLQGIMDSHPPDLGAVADTIYYEYPELGRRQAGRAVLWARENPGERKRIVAVQPLDGLLTVDPDYLEEQDLDNTHEAFLNGTR